MDCGQFLAQGKVTMMCKTVVSCKLASCSVQIAFALVGMAIFFESIEARADETDNSNFSIQVDSKISEGAQSRLDKIVENIQERRRSEELANSPISEDLEVAPLRRFMAENEGSESALTARVVLGVLMTHYGPYSNYKEVESFLHEIVDSSPGTWQSGTADYLQITIDMVHKPRVGESVPPPTETVRHRIRLFLPYARIADNIENPSVSFIRQTLSRTTRGKLEAGVLMSLAHEYEKDGDIDQALLQLREIEERFLDPVILGGVRAELKRLELYPIQTGSLDSVALQPNSNANERELSNVEADEIDQSYDPELLNPSFVRSGQSSPEEGTSEMAERSSQVVLHDSGSSPSLVSTSSKWSIVLLIFGVAALAIFGVYFYFTRGR
jgi:hypothetical protein